MSFFAFLLAFFSFTVFHLFSRFIQPIKFGHCFRLSLLFFVFLFFEKSLFIFESLPQFPFFHLICFFVTCSGLKFCCKCVEFCHCFVQTRFVFAPIMVICALLGSCGDSVLSIPFVCGSEAFWVCSESRQ